MLEQKNVFDKARLDMDFAEKLKKECPTQLKTLCLMHLSFLLDMNENEPEQSDKAKIKKNWLFPKKKSSSICTSLSSVKSPDAPVLTPELINQLICLMNFLESDENLSQEGIFRKTGSVTRQQELKFLVNQLKPLNLEEYTCHDVASVLKSILADLPEPLLTETYIPAYSQVAEICNSKENDEQARIQNSLQLLCLLLPSENRIVLQNLITLLHKTSNFELHNKMTADTLATLFTPHLICPKKLQPEVLHQTAATMTRMVSFMITNGNKTFLVPEKLSTDIRAYFVEQKRRRETPERVLDESINSDSVANTVFTFVDREKTAEAHVQNTTDTALAQLYAHIQSMPESSKKKKLIKQFNKQNGQGTPLQFVNRDKPSSACKSIGDSIKKHIFHKARPRTPKRDGLRTPSSSAVCVVRTPMNSQALPNKRILFQSPISEVPTSPLLDLKPPHIVITPASSASTSISSSGEVSNVFISKTNENEFSSDVKIDDTLAIPSMPSRAEIAQEEMIDDEDFCSSDEEDVEPPPVAIAGPADLMEHKSIATEKKCFLTSKLLKGVSLGNLKFPFHSSVNTPKSSPTMKKSISSSILVDIEKDEEKKKFHSKSATESFDSEESDLFYSMCDASKEHWHVDVSNINYFLNQTGAQEHPAVRNSMSPITKSTQRMPKSMQESIMTPRSRKPVMLAMFGHSDNKFYQNNISELVEESEEDVHETSESQASGEMPLNMTQLKNLRSKSESDISSANDNGLPVVESVRPGKSSENSESLSNAFRDYITSRGNLLCDMGQDQDDDSFSSQPDDFDDSNEYQKLENSSTSSSLEKSSEIDQILSKSSMSESLLYILDGNGVSLSPSPESTRKRPLESDDLSSEDSTESKRPLIESEITDV